MVMSDMLLPIMSHQTFKLHCRWWSIWWSQHGFFDDQ